eukprot:TRINITY_DN26172_c0_g1_i2.p1 TRINITY_DN26172_c0_g1~~TRINITY_DN26172_c0_g1_i2.p1  ORF type:complete len:344 (-),score=-7.22 TRINITY_DN26172_c0_g1_i2:370-1302(-)
MSAAAPIASGSSERLSSSAASSAFRGSAPAARFLRVASRPLPPPRLAIAPARRSAGPVLASARRPSPAQFGLPSDGVATSWHVAPSSSDRRSVRAAVYDGEAFEEPEDPQEAARRAQASKRVESTARYFRRLGVVGFWGQLVCAVVASVILTFSIVISGKPTAPVSTYLTSAGIVAAFLSVFWSFGYLRLADRLRSAVDNPMKAPPRTSVVANLKNGLVINLLGLGATLLGLQATVGVLVAKALTSTAPTYGAIGLPTGYNPVLALDVFLVQASGNTALAHFLGLVLTLELLRSVTMSQPPPETVIPKPE